MAKVIVMPKLGYTQDSGAIAAWLKNEGDTVERGEALFDVHTDKTVVTVESSATGTLLNRIGAGSNRSGTDTGLCHR